ncbi:hypothetical protein P4S72_25280 [Vibrio sp. PP-XX7]
MDLNLDVESKLREYIKVLSSRTFEGRKIGSSGGKKTINWLVNILKSLGLQSVTPEYKQTFEAQHCIINSRKSFAFISKGKKR